MKYRIVQKGDRYYPQYKWGPFWLKFTKQMGRSSIDECFFSEIKADSFIEEKIKEKVISKIFKVVKTYE